MAWAEFKGKRLRQRVSDLVFLFEAVSLGGLHLVDVLQEVSDPDGRVELTRVVWRTLPPTVAVRRAPQETAGLVDGAALLIWENKHMQMKRGGRRGGGSRRRLCSISLTESRLRSSEAVLSAAPENTQTDRRPPRRHLT